MLPDDTAETIQSDETLFAIIDTLQETDGAGLTELSERVGVSKSSVHRHLNTLRKYRFAKKEGTEYRLGLRFLELGGHTRYSIRPYRNIKPTVNQIAEETGEFAGFFVEEHGVGTYLYIEMGPEGVPNDARVGQQTKLHHSAAGKTILAHLPNERVEEIIDRHGLPAKNERTTTDYEVLKTELAQIRERGYAIARGEYVDKLWALAVPVRDQDDTVLGSLFVAGPSHRMRGDWFTDELPETLQSAEKEYQLKLSHS
jgi:DNA-binding IclR family transcriptional regulator